MTEPQTLPAELPVLPIRNTVLFPGISMPLVVGRPRSLAALDKAETMGRLLLIVAQKNITPGDPEPRDLYLTGTLCRVENAPAGQEDNSNGGSSRGAGQQIVVTGIARYRVLDYRLPPASGTAATTDLQPIWARGEVVADLEGHAVRTQGLFETLKGLATEIIELMPGTTDALVRLIDRMDDPAYLTHVASAYLNLNLPQKQDLLETVDLNDRMQKLIELIGKEKDVLGIQKEIRDKMSERLSKAQREALLREQLKTIRGELGEEGAEEVSEDLEEKISRAQMPPEAAKQAEEELKRLKQLPSASAEYHVVRSYLEWLASLPWRNSTPDRLDLAQARQVLDEDHAGLEPVKRRILQFLAVAKLKNDLSGPILCLVGPPGVGKTSLGQSIARAVGRKFIRTSLGGVRDEAEIRGHRRTYVGAMPGRIIQSIKRAGTRNPIMMLDEIDKMRADFQGDPSSAMLEVLDPEQNHSFVDHYLDVPFDLSQVFFIATANVLETIPPPLRDRMEVIEVNGYTTEEKLTIAAKHLFPKQLKENGMTTGQLEVPEETWLSLITYYTREAGVRELQRKIASLIRSAAEKIVSSSTPTLPLVVGAERLHEFLGPRKFEPEIAERTPRAGMATGLAWTPHGGDILFIEAAKMPGRGNLVLTGQLGDVMRESAQIALSLVRQTQQILDFSQNDIHIHVPAGGIPKDGPSAGITLVTALASLLRDARVDPLLGMTGEITLRGVVLPVGGIKEKLIAAHRAGLRTILLPSRNAPDLEEVPRKVLDALKIEFVSTIDDVLEAVFGAPEQKAA